MRVGDNNFYWSPTVNGLNHLTLDVEAMLVHSHTQGTTERESHLYLSYYEYIAIPYSPYNRIPLSTHIMTSSCNDYTSFITIFIKILKLHCKW